MALVFMVLAGLFEMIYLTTNQTLLQLSIPDSLRGRVTGIVSFRTLTDRTQRAMAGLSMDSCVTLQTTLHNLDLFDTIGVFSRPPLGDEDDNRARGGGGWADG